MCYIVQGNYILGASSSPGVDTDVNAAGIVQGHAYSLLKVMEVDGHRLLCLRNPWGRGEWTGRWADNSKEWTPRYKKLLNQTDDR